MKACTKCGETKPLNCFRFRKERNSYRSACKDCEKADSVAFRENNPDYWRDWHEAHPDKNTEYNRKWRSKNPHASRAGSARRRGFYAVGTFPAHGWKMMLDYYGESCMKCGAAEDLQLDHVVPLSRGGQHTLSNAQILCGDCNRKKGNRDSTDYRTSLLTA